MSEVERSNLRFELSIKVDEEWLENSEKATAVELIADNTDLSKQKIKRAMQAGSVWQSQGKSAKRLRRASKKLKTGDQIYIYYDEQLINMAIPEPHVVADEGKYSVWFKPYGLLSQGSKWGDHCTINRWAETKLLPQRPAFVVHRLDRAARGLMLIAHSKGAAAKLSELFQKREIDKQYSAIVKDKFPSEVTQLNTSIDGKKAVSIISRTSYDSEQNLSLLNVKIETGRKHQIRKHLSEFGFPIVGDRLYGDGGKEFSGVDLQLCSKKLAFICPLSGAEKDYRLASEFDLGLDLLT